MTCGSSKLSTFNYPNKSFNDTPITHNNYPKISPSIDPCYQRNPICQINPSPPPACTAHLLPPPSQTPVTRVKGKQSYKDLKRALRRS
ncbi:hypothetical protein CKAN_00631900 [Cinnamomum micranthum f. kanehirae]|uniref:Uncharacterized protein n=1 Tax=Cinnamomum micranthum f. kanehirae TaxID=337451 RepID=A0A443NH18_9MAGN|nr:hypothetical protein CKAN_00631900 [Cinnamomum micranthum f. kanehirae]